MVRSFIEVLSAATIFVAAFGLSGCSTEPQSVPAATTPAASAPAQPSAAPLPDPAALTDVLVKLSDPAVPGTDKLPLVEGATADEAAVLDNFSKALADNHMLPLTFTAADVAWSERNPGNVRATVTATGAKPDARPFTFPMEFLPTQVGWQMSRETADMLLAFGADQQSPAPAPGPSPAQSPGPSPAQPPGPTPAPPR